MDPRPLVPALGFTLALLLAPALGPGADALLSTSAAGSTACAPLGPGTPDLYEAHVTYEAKATGDVIDLGFIGEAGKDGHGGGHGSRAEYPILEAKVEGDQRFLMAKGTTVSIEVRADAWSDGNPDGIHSLRLSSEDCGPQGPPSNP